MGVGIFPSGPVASRIFFFFFVFKKKIKHKGESCRIMRCIKNLLNNKHGLNFFFFFCIKFWKSIVAYSRLGITLENKIPLDLWTLSFCT
jgi:hypothetical protein